MSTQTSHVCPVCVRTVLDSDEGTGCDGPCHRWFHRDCMKISRAEYSKLSGDTSLKWYCSRADCNPGDPISELSIKMTLLLDKFSDLATKDEFKGVKSGILELSKKVDTLTAKLLEFEPRLSAAEGNILKVEAEIKELKERPSAHPDGEELYAEASERSRRLRNVILYNIPEVNSGNKQSHDLNLITKIYTILDLQLPDNIYFSRLGRASSGNDRPIKLILPDEGTALMLLKRFSPEDLVEADGCFSKVSIARDKTLKERRYLNDLRKSLEDRIKAGESNLTIKYVNGIPKIIVKSVSKN